MNSFIAIIICTDQHVQPEGQLKSSGISFSNVHRASYNLSRHANTRITRKNVIYPLYFLTIKF